MQVRYDIQRSFTSSCLKPIAYTLAPKSQLARLPGDVQAQGRPADAAVRHGRRHVFGDAWDGALGHPA